MTPTVPWRRPAGFATGATGSAPACAAAASAKKPGVAPTVSWRRPAGFATGAAGSTASFGRDCGSSETNADAPASDDGKRRGRGRLS